jgi:hypothetical protein
MDFRLTRARKIEVLLNLFVIARIIPISPESGNHSEHKHSLEGGIIEQ